MEAALDLTTIYPTGSLVVAVIAPAGAAPLTPDTPHLRRGKRNGDGHPIVTSAGPPPDRRAWLIRRRQPTRSWKSTGHQTLSGARGHSAVSRCPPTVPTALDAVEDVDVRRAPAAAQLQPHLHHVRGDTEPTGDTDDPDRRSAGRRLHVAARILPTSLPGWRPWTIPPPAVRGCEPAPNTRPPIRLSRRGASVCPQRRRRTRDSACSAARSTNPRPAHVVPRRRGHRRRGRGTSPWLTNRPGYAISRTRVSARWGGFSARPRRRRWLPRSPPRPPG